MRTQSDWVENPEKHSPCFDMKWTLKVKDIDFRSLQEHQLVNHFEKNSKITTKVGLSHSLRNLIWFNNIDIDTFFPRCFDASEATELEDLIMEIKAVKVESILKEFCQGGKIEENVVMVALNVCRRRIKDLDDLIDDPNIQNFTLITPEEWEILSADEMSLEELQKKKHEDWLTRNEMKPEAVKPKKKRKKSAVKRAAESVESEESDCDEDSLLGQVKSVLSQMKEKFPQFDLNGYRNAWIVKPAGLSRGRGIACFNSLVQIVDYMRKEGQWVVQKYIENPLLILNKKFDIRQWVLVTDFNPLTVWFYESCYLRFGVEDFDISNLQNKYIHLTNNSVVKHSDKFCETEIEGSMWHSEEFAEYLREQNGSDVWEESIKPKVKNIVRYSLEAAQDMIEHRKNSCELFGYDIMIDENLNPWLIEVNSSPAMDYSTPITKRLVKEVLEDCVKVLVDYGYASSKKKPTTETGKFTLIYKAKRKVEQPHQAFGLNLVCQGKPLR